MPWRCALDLVTSVRCLRGRLLRQLEREAVDARDARAGEDRSLGRDFLGQAAVRAAAAAGILALGVLAHDHPVDRLPAAQRAPDARQQPRGPHVGVLVEALADRQAQPPQRQVVGHVGRADRAEEDGVERLEPLEPALGYVMAVLEVVVAAPREMLDRETESAVAGGEYLQHFQPGRDDFDADAVAGDGCDSVLTHLNFVIGEW